MKKIFTLLILISALSFQEIAAQSTTVVISQAYGGGGGTTGTYLNDYVELHNVSNVPQDISGFVVGYGSATGNWGSSSGNCDTLPASTIIPAGGYYLIQYGATGTGGVALPVTPDRISSKLSMSGTNGKVGLFSTSWVANSLPGTVSTFSVDRVAWGSGNDPETTATAVLTSTQGVVRKTNGCTDTDNNSNDFDIVTGPTPRNSASSIVNCTTTPIKLNSFNAVGFQNSVNLSWLSHADQTGGSFVVERSIDGSNFENISTIASTNIGNANYEATDRNLPAVKTLYYRLKIVNADGRYEYSNIQKVVLKDVKLTVSPNPASNEILVNATENIKSVELFDIRGRRMMVKDNINQNQTRINVTSIIEGAYIVKTTVGSETTTTQILIKH